MFKEFAGVVKSTKELRIDVSVRIGKAIMKIKEGKITGNKLFLQYPEIFEGDSSIVENMKEQVLDSLEN